MLLKLIRCTVAPGSKETFANGQQAYSALHGCPGFVEQSGGFADAPRAAEDQLQQGEQAWLAAWWKDWSSYSDFRSDLHDLLHARSGHALSCARTEVSYWDSVAGEKVDRTGNLPADAYPEVLQIEQLELAPGTLPEFKEFLNWRWRPSLSGLPGLFQARLCRHRKHTGRYLIWSTWAGDARATSIASLLQPGFRVPQRRLQLLRRHETQRVPLRAAWQVGGSPLPPRSIESESEQEQE